MARPHAEIQKKSYIKLNQLIDGTLTGVKITPAELHRRSGISKAQLSDLLHGKTRLTEYTAEAIINVFPEYRSQWLIDDDDNIAKKSEYEALINLASDKIAYFKLLEQCGYTITETFKNETNEIIKKQLLETICFCLEYESEADIANALLITHGIVELKTQKIVALITDTKLTDLHNQTINAVKKIINSFIEK